jgi:hypothetical protein
MALPPTREQALLLCPLVALLEAGALVAMGPSRAVLAGLPPGHWMLAAADEEGGAGAGGWM